jgi:hypothetical protein
MELCLFNFELFFVVLNIFLTCVTEIFFAVSNSMVQQYCLRHIVLSNNHSLLIS